ncbi:putative transposase [Neokomagataea tanensis NBRC 106556]|uniref:Transposase n=1 Tax=Neokomagataea tanensis NBRC 106556 TaxID=1223519 RepID=A0ABQ0QIF4_9PROT|nr:putative transposase [Neokomagataea tanensis NBRC 106556]
MAWRCKELKYEGKLSGAVQYWQGVRLVRGFRTLKSTYATIRGFEIMRAMKKGQSRFFQFPESIVGNVRLVERHFGIYNI